MFQTFPTKKEEMKQIMNKQKKKQEEFKENYRAAPLANNFWIITAK